MSTEMSIEQARAKLGDLVIAAMGGQSTTITRYGRPVARIVPFEERTMTETTTYTAAADEVLAERGWRRVGDWDDSAGDAAYAPVERA